MFGSAHFVQTGERTRIFNYTVNFFYSFKGNFSGQQTVTFESQTVRNLEVGESYLFTFGENTRLEFCSYFYPLYIENRDANVDSIKWKDIVELSGPSGLRLIKGFNDEALSGNWKGFRSSRLNQQYRVIYSIENGEMFVLVLDVTPHDYRRRS